MIELLSGTKYIPSWAIQYVFAGILWGGINFILITPVIYDRITLPYKTEFTEKVSAYNRFNFNDKITTKYIETYVDCIYSKYFYYNREELTIWTISLGYKNKLDAYSMGLDMDDIIDRKVCGIAPWISEK